MYKLFLTLSAAIALTVGSANAQAPIAPPGYGPVMPAVYGESIYGGGGHVGGFLPGKGLGGGLLSGLFTNHGHGKRMFGADPNQAKVLPVATGGTLVFPQNPFVRSPRDFFMYYER